MNSDERFWNASIEELKQGYVYEEAEGYYYCLICGEGFEDGEIFREEPSGRWFEARKYAGHHVKQSHGSMLDYLLELDKRQTGLTDLQKELIRGFSKKLSDQELMSLSGAGSTSTIRNHRFVLKEKAKQAKLLLAIMEMMEQGAAAPRFVPVHRTATQVDERYAITEDENAALLKQYLPKGLNGPLASFPRKEKRKIAVLRHIASFFNIGTKYSEKAVNEKLVAFWEEDYVTLRRYLIEYGFLDRSDDGRAYWVKDAADSSTGAAAPKKKDLEVQGAALKQETKAKQGKQSKQKEQIKQKAQSKTEQQEDKRKDEVKMDKAKRKQLTAEYQERERVMGVFQIKNNANGKLYIGGSTNLDALWGREQFMLNMGTHASKELQKEWKQFGSENFSFLVLETVKLDQKIRYDYKDVLDPEGRQPVDMVRQYNREVGALKEQWLEKLQPFGEKGYHAGEVSGNAE
ncbi:hypothetical protein FHS16_000988 [Paenibacillus endophyticus]|uniref:DUF2087 domain-containing protein n=1 Tax=Paenibacillus endophyticus TaxID=1294268 RepID=A0A7W5G8D1_9BACL|nr:DUF2087 domain-containing protein [Paenibacillus endophyticus]MBB3150954.1 hypothetical protein [Paenibacillus endophyticus]